MERVDGRLVGNYDKLVITSGESLSLDINQTVAASSGNVHAIDFDVTNTVNGIVNFRAFTVDLTMGANCSGPYAGYFRTDIASHEVAGLSAALGMELILSSAAGKNGEAHGMTIDVACPSGSDPGGTTASKHSFIKVETWGNETAMGKWDDYANLFFINGPVAGSGNLIGSGNSTLRINIAGTSRYVPTSSAEESFTSAYPIVLTDYQTITMTGGSANQIGLTSSITANVDWAGWAIGTWGSVNISATSGASAKNALGGLAELRIASGFAATGTGLVAGMYVGAYSDQAGKSPNTCLIVEGIASNGVDLSLMPLAVFMSSGAGTEPYIAFEFGHVAAGKTVTTAASGTDCMYRTSVTAANIN